jgi:hypothetical protein
MGAALQAERLDASSVRRGGSRGLRGTDVGGLWRSSSRDDAAPHRPRCRHHPDRTLVQSSAGELSNPVTSALLELAWRLVAGAEPDQDSGPVDLSAHSAL